MAGGAVTENVRCLGVRVACLDGALPLPMDSIFRGDLSTARGRALAWADSLLVDHGLLRLAWTNFAAVVPGRLYRSNHPPPGRLARVVRRFGIRTMINLRGATGNGSDALSRREGLRLGLHVVDVPLSSGRAPAPDRILALAAAYATSPEPILVHCKSGADRSGFAGAVFLLANGATTRQAMRQLSLWHGHMKGSRAGVLDAVLLEYACTGEGRLSFLDWVRTEYDPALVTSRFKAGRLSDFVMKGLLRRE